MFEQPARGKVDHRLRRTQLLVALPGWAPYLLGTQVAQTRSQARCVQVDGMDAGEDLTALFGQLRSDRSERGVAHDARTERLTLKPFHDETVTEAILGREHCKNFRLGHTGSARGTDQHGFGRKARIAAVPRRHRSWRTPHRQLALAGIGANDDAIRFLTGATR